VHKLYFSVKQFKFVCANGLSDIVVTRLPVVNYKWTVDKVNQILVVAY